MDTSANNFLPGDRVNYVLQPQNRYRCGEGSTSKGAQCVRTPGVFLKYVPKKSAAVEFTRDNGLKTVRIVLVEKLEKSKE